METIFRNLVGTSVRYLIVLFAGWLIQRGIEVSEDQIRQWTEAIVGIIIILGTLAYSQYVRRKDQKNPDPAKSPNYDKHLPLFIIPFLLLIVGCAADDAAKAERIALQIKAATTQPTAQILVQAAPATAPIIAGVGAGAGLAALVFGWFARRK